MNEIKKITAVNASPRKEWNTGTLIREAARGAKEQGAEVEIFDLYELEKYTGCISCFGCKLPGHEGDCIYRDSLTQVLNKIRNSDGLIIGSPNYLGNATAGFRALYERLVFPFVTYKTDPTNYNNHKIPVLFIMTSNVSEEAYSRLGYDMMLSQYQNTLNNFVGPTKIMISGNTLQVKDYDKYAWTAFDPDMKKARHIKNFPLEKQKAFDFGVQMITNPWK